MIRYSETKKYLKGQDFFDTSRWQRGKKGSAYWDRINLVSAEGDMLVAWFVRIIPYSIVVLNCYCIKLVEYLCPCVLVSCIPLSLYSFVLCPVSLCPCKPCEWNLFRLWVSLIWSFYLIPEPHAAIQSLISEFGLIAFLKACYELFEKTTKRDVCFEQMKSVYARCFVNIFEWESRNI